jgi:exonuclease III
VRVVTWNMGGVTYRGKQGRAWSQVMAWDPDVALLQEVYRPDRLDEHLWSWTPYEGIPDRGTLIYSKDGLTSVETTGQFHTAVSGQVTLAEVQLDGAPILFASVHAVTSAVSAHLLDGLDTADVSSWGGKSIYSLDLILADVSAATRGRRFVIGGDFNAALRYDLFHRYSSVGSGYTRWFMKARDAGWRAAHPKFHSGEERTLFRKGLPEGENHQVDHLFTDDTTWDQLTRCDVLHVPYLNEFTDHAPLAMEWESQTS